MSEEQEKVRIVKHGSGKETKRERERERRRRRKEKEQLVLREWEGFSHGGVDRQRQGETGREKEMKE